MAWEMQEALEYYQKQGAPSDQFALVNLLKEIQEERGGSLAMEDIGEVTRAYGLKESYLLAIVKRLPSLRLDNTHCLEICGGPVCSKRARLETFVRKTYGEKPEKFRMKYVGCMRQCGKGPNIRFDGVLYNGADEKLIRSLVDGL